MQFQNKRNKVIFVSILNLIGFVIHLIFTSIAINSNNKFTFIAVSLIWVSAFTIIALRHSTEEHYPAVALTAMAWPAFGVAIFAFIFLASYLGFKV
ncbi:MAG: hypothetical protein Q7U15_06160 [Methylotenera sp.]|nr:hypothetical protein [Methylotenera sp.]